MTEWGIYSVGGRPPGRAVIAFYSFSSGEAREVLRPEKDIAPGFVGLSVSPDGKWLLYTQSDQRGTDIMLVENFR